MSDSESSHPALGLDIGTSRIVLARRVKGDFQYQTQLNAFLTLPFSKLTREVFEKEKIPHQVDGADLIVYGNDSERLANTYRCETRRPMMRGILNADEPHSLTMIKQLLTTLLGQSGKNGRRLCFSVPGTPRGASSDLTYHQTTLRQFLTGLGFEVTSIEEGLAVILAELADTNYTGIGVSCGGGMCNVCLAYLSVPIFSFSIPKAGDFIDSSAASAAGSGATAIRAVKEHSFRLNGQFGDKMQQALAVYYDEMIRSLVVEMKETFESAGRAPQLDRPIPMVVSGGSSLPSGFRDRFELILKEIGLPLTVSEVRVPSDPLNTTAKGALISALAEI